MKPERTICLPHGSDEKRFWRELFKKDRDLWMDLRLDSLLRATAALPPVGNEAKRLPYTFVVGSFGTQITIHDQQWLGIEVAEAIIRVSARRNDGEITPAEVPPVCIVGAGFAGTAAATWLLRGHPGKTFKCTLIEGGSTILMPKIRNSDCWVHPNIWEWPREGYESDETYFPDEVEGVLGWKSGSIKRVAKKIADNVQKVEGLKGNLKCNEVIEADDIQPHDEGVYVRIKGVWEHFGAMLLCTGFGTPRTLQGATKAGRNEQYLHTGSDFWSTCGRSYDANKKHLVLGGGDTALMEAVHRCTGKTPFELWVAAITCELGEDFKRLGDKFRRQDQVSEIDRGLADTHIKERHPTRQNADSPYKRAVMEFFLELSRNGQWGKWEKWVSEVLNFEQNVVLATPREVEHSRSARINRIMCVLLHAASRFRKDPRSGEDPWKGRDISPEIFKKYIEKEADMNKLKPTDDPPKEISAEYDKYKAAEEKFADVEADILHSPLMDRGSMELRSSKDDWTHKVPPGLTIAPYVEWIGKAKRGDKSDCHLARVQGDQVTAGEYDEFAPCIGQEPPELLKTLSDRIDLDSLRIRQRDWKWYR